MSKEELERKIGETEKIAFDPEEFTSFASRLTSVQVDILNRQWKGEPVPQKLHDEFDRFVKIARGAFQAQKANLS